VNRYIEQYKSHKAASSCADVVPPAQQFVSTARATVLCNGTAAEVIQLKTRCVNCSLLSIIFSLSLSRSEMPHYDVVVTPPL